MIEEENNANSREVNRRADELVEKTHRLVEEAAQARGVAERGLAAMSVALNKLAEVDIDLAAIIAEGQKPR